MRRRLHTMLALFAVLVAATMVASTTPATAASSYIVKVLGPDQVMRPGQQVSSWNGRHKIVHQTDGNVVLYFYLDKWYGVWSTNTGGRKTTALVMQSDGNLVLYNGSTALWSTRTAGQGPSVLSMNYYGDLTINRVRDNKLTWTTGLLCGYC